MANDVAIKAIETFYHGYRMRSRTEARWGVFLTELGVKWEYECEGYTLPSGAYLPDFWLPDQKVWLEVKPATAYIPAREIYVAGKMDLDRDGLKMRGHRQSGPGKAWHGDDDPEFLVGECFSAISSSHDFFAYIDQWDCYGTLVEIGYARAKGVPVHLVFGGEVENHPEFWNGHLNHGSDFNFPMWFASELGGCRNKASSLQAAFDLMFPLTGEERKCAELSGQTGDRSGRVVMVCGVPGESGFVSFFEGDAVRRGTEFNLGSALGVSDPFLEKTDGRVSYAIAVARAARFEHGEAPR